MYLLSQVNPTVREEFLRAGALNAAWKAHGFETGIEALREAMEENPGLEPEKLAQRRQFLAVTIRFLEASREKQMLRALEHLKFFEQFKKGELDENAMVPT